MRRGNKGQQIPRDQGDLPWFNFPQVVSKRTMVEWNKKLETLQMKEFYLANEMSFSWLEEVGLVDVMNPYLTKIFVDDRVGETSSAWRRLFQLHEPVYSELCMEFYATMRFWGWDDYFDMHALICCPGGVHRECSITELA